MKYLRIILTRGFQMLWYFLFYVNRYARHPEKYPLEKRYKKVRALIRLVLDSFRLDFKLKGLENLRELERSGKNFYLIANHISDCDPLVLVYLSEKPISFVAKMETKKMPFVGKVIKALDGLFLDRADMKASLVTMLTLYKRLEEGRNYMIFPEGTRNRDENNVPLLEYKAGSFKPAKKAEVPIIVSSIVGTPRILKPKPNNKRTPVEITFFKPFSPDEVAKMSTEELAEKSQKMTYDELKIQKKLDEEFFKNGYEKVPLKKGPLR